MEAGERFQAGKRFPRTYRSKGSSEYRYVAAQEEEPIKVEEEVLTLISTETEIKDAREAGELTQVEEEAEVDVKMLDEGEAGEQATHDVMKDVMNEMAGEQATHDVMKDEMNEMAGEQTQMREFEVRVVDDELSAGEQTQTRDGMVLGAGEQTYGGVDQDSCSGSVMGAEKYANDWMEDSIVIDIGVDATDWDGELDADAVQKQIADADSEDGTGAGSEDSAEVGVSFEKEKLVMRDIRLMRDDRTGQIVRLGSDCGIDGFAAWLDSLSGGGTEDSAEVGVGSGD